MNINSLVSGVVQIGIEVETVLTVNDGRCKVTSNGESITDHSPLWLIEGHYFAQIVDQSGQVEPVLIRVAGTDSFGRLERMDDIGQVGIGIGLMKKSIL